MPANHRFQLPTILRREFSRRGGSRLEHSGGWRHRELILFPYKTKPRVGKRTKNIVVMHPSCRHLTKEARTIRRKGFSQNSQRAPGQRESKRDRIHGFFPFAGARQMILYLAWPPRPTCRVASTHTPRSKVPKFCLGENLLFVIIMFGIT